MKLNEEDIDKLNLVELLLLLGYSSKEIKEIVKERN